MSDRRPVSASHRSPRDRARGDSYRTTCEHRTPEETPAAIARAIAALACASTEGFGAFLNDDDNGRDKLCQRLVERLTADKPLRNLLTTDQEIAIVERLEAALPIDEDRAVLINEDAVFLSGVEIGRRAQGGQTKARNLKPEAESPSTTGRSVEHAMLHVVSVLHLVKAVVDSQLGDVATINRDAFYALRDLLEETATPRALTRRMIGTAPSPTRCTPRPSQAVPTRRPFSYRSSPTPPVEWRARRPRSAPGSPLAKARCSARRARPRRPHPRSR